MAEFIFREATEEEEDNAIAANFHKYSALEVQDDKGLNVKPLSKIDTMLYDLQYWGETHGVKPLGDLATGIKAIKDTEYKRLVPEFTKSVTRAANTLLVKNVAGGGMSVVGRMLYDDNGNEDNARVKVNHAIFGTIRDFGDSIKKTSEEWNNSNLLKPDEKYFVGSFEQNPNLIRALDLAASGSSSLVAAYALAPVVGPEMAILAMSGADCMDVFDESLAAGNGKLKSLGLFSLATVGTAAMEKLPVEKAFGVKFTQKGLEKVIDSTKKTSVKIAEAMLAEGGTEGLQTVYQNTIAKVGYDDARDIFEGAVEAIIGGALGGGMVSGVNFGYESFVNRAKKAGLNDQDIDNVINATAQTMADKPELIDVPFQENMKKTYQSFEKMIADLGDTPEAQRLIAKKQALDNVYNQYFETFKQKMPENQAKANAQLVRSSALYFADLDGISVDEWLKTKAPQIKWIGDIENQERTFERSVTPTKLTLDEKEINLFEALKNPELVKQYRKKDRRKSLLQFIRKRGGVKDVGGDLKAMDLHKKWGIVNNKNGESLDDMALAAWEHGYFIGEERPTINDLLEAMRDESFGNKRYAEEKELGIDDYVAQLAEEMDRLGIDYSNMSAREAEQAYNDAVAKYGNQNYVPAEQNADENIDALFDLGEAFFQIAEENARLDEQYPAYEGETININGQEKTVYNSNGDRIAKSKEALENFYRWFGDSKVVDEQGRPLVVYHGTGAEFSVFDITKAGESTHNKGLFGQGFYSSNKEKMASSYRRKSGNLLPDGQGFIMPLYYKLENPFMWFQGGRFKEAKESIEIAKKLGFPKERIQDDGDGFIRLLPLTKDEQIEKFTQSLKDNGYDGVIFKYSGTDLFEYVAFDANQIKSTSNRGTYSESDNIYYQFAGEKAQTAALDELNKAKQLDANGVDNEEIRQKTGWFKGADGKWRFEISDEDAKMLGTIEELRQKNEDKHEKTLKKLAKLEKEREKLRIAVNKNKITENEYYSKLEENDKKIQTLMDNDEGFRIRDIMKHDKLYEAYPFIANINVFISERIDPDEAYYDRKSQSITVGTNVAKEPASSINLKGIILHEIQHAIQATEGFARGGSPDEFESMEQLRRGLEQGKQLLDEANEALETAEDLGYSDDTDINGMPVSFYREQKEQAQKQIDYANERISNYKDPYQKYKSLYGEIEARNTAIRSEFTEELRGKISPERTQDVANADAIVIFDDGTAMAYKPETYYQSAFAGSRVDYDRPSLEAIGSGEGNQAHGWGLYYALDRDVAEGYRKRLSRQSGYKYNGKELNYLQFGKYNAASGKRRALQDIIVKSTGQELGEEFADIVEELKEKYKQTIEDSKPYDSDFWKRERKIAEENLKGIEQIDLSKLEKANKGQTYEVDIPENPYLLDEQKSYREQSDYVKEALTKIDNELQNAKRKEKIFDKKEDAIDFYDSKIDEFEEKANGYQRFFPESFVTDDGKFGVRYADDYTIYEPLIGEDLGITGEGIYSAIARRLGSQKEASLLLEKYGIKGITYFGRQDGRCFVIFNPADVKVIQKFYQRGKADSYLGAYTNRIIYLNQNANESTLPHELAHFWSDMLRQSKSLKAKEILKQVDKWAEKEFERKYSIAKQGDVYVVTDKSGKTVYDLMGEGFKNEENAKAYAKEELFARGFEKYLREGGKAPSRTLKSAFNNFYNWLKKIYVDLANLDIKLSPAMRNLYGELLGGTNIDTFLSEDLDGFIEQRQIADEEREQFVEQQSVQMENAPIVKKRDLQFAKTWDNLVVPLSTRAKRINPKLRNKLRRYEHDVLQSNLNYKERIMPMLQKWNAFSPEDKFTFDLALKNNTPRIRDRILQKYDAEQEFKAVQDVLEEIHEQAINAGLDVGYIEDYYPRKVKDVNGLLSYLHGTEQWSAYQQAFEQEFGKNANVGAEEQAEFMDKFLRGIKKADVAGYKYSSEKARKLDTIDNTLNQYYADSLNALLDYIDGMNARIQTANFFGRNRNNVEESIGEFVDNMVNNGEIKPQQVDEVKDILKAVFGRRGVSWNWLKKTRDIAYIYTMGGVNTAITQIDDLFVAAYKGGVFNTIKTLMGEKPITKKDLGLENIAAEFVNGDATSKMVNKVFKATGLDFIDSIGKNTLINSVYNKMRGMTDEQLRKYIEPVMEDETQATIDDIRNNDIHSDRVRFFLFNELSDMQPISLSELPALYNTGGNARIFYMLKSFMLKRIDTFRNEVFDKINNGNRQEKIEGIQNLFKLMMLMMLGGASKDVLIDLLYGRKIDLSDMVINNLLGLVGISKYNIYQAKQEGFGHTVALFAFPPIFQVADDLFGDVDKFLKGKRELKDFEALKGLPIIGRFYYWWIGRGREKEKKKKKRA